MRLSIATGHLIRHQTPTLFHLASLKGAFTGLGVPFEEDEEVVDTPMALGVPDPKAPTAGLAGVGPWSGMQLGINMPALAVPLGALSDATGAAVDDKGSSVADRPVPEEVVLCFGIIDILQVSPLLACPDSWSADPASPRPNWSDQNAVRIVGRLSSALVKHLHVCPACIAAVGRYTFVWCGDSFKPKTICCLRRSCRITQPARCWRELSRESHMTSTASV